MDDLVLLERQKERECSWVAEGAEAFMVRLRTEDPAMTPMGKGIIKRAGERYLARLEAYKRETANSRSPMKNPTYQVLVFLGVPHVASVVLHIATMTVIRGGVMTDPSRHTIVRMGQQLAEALEADIRFRVWRKDAEGSVKFAVERMREDMKAGDAKTWRTRAKQLRELAESPWDKGTLCTVGVDLLGLMTQAAPDVFQAETLQHGHKTLLMFKLQPGVEEALLADTAAMATQHQRVGMMLVPPRPWRYEEKS